MVASAMNITLTEVDVQVHGDLDFRGTMGTDRETPVGFTRIRTEIKLAADAPPERLERLAKRAEQYCVVNATLSHSPELTTTISFGDDQ
jgi:uncharacterized OsmC-like protein